MTRQSETADKAKGPEIGALIMGQLNRSYNISNLAFAKRFFVSEGFFFKARLRLLVLIL